MVVEPKRALSCSIQTVGCWTTQSAQPLTEWFSSQLFVSDTKWRNVWLAQQSTVSIKTYDVLLAPTSLQPALTERPSSHLFYQAHHVLLGSTTPLPQMYEVPASLARRYCPVWDPATAHLRVSYPSFLFRRNKLGSGGSRTPDFFGRT